MSMIVLTLLVFGVLLFLAEVVFDHPYHAYLEGAQESNPCAKDRRLSVAEFLSRALPFVFALIGTPLLFCSFWDGLAILVLAGLSRLAGTRLKKRPA